jgi:hypothetical protein
MASKYSPADYLFQFITVTAGVFIALVIDGLTDWNNNRELVAEARSTIAREIRDNKKDLDITLSGFARDREEIGKTLTFATELLNSKKTDVTSFSLHYNLADLSSTSWHTAERTGALSHMDYDEVQRLSKLYDLQELVITQQRNILTQLTAATAIMSSDFDPAKPNMKDLEAFRERVMQLGGSMKIIEDFAKRLAENYAEYLGTVK